MTHPSIQQVIILTVDIITVTFVACHTVASKTTWLLLLVVQKW